MASRTHADLHLLVHSASIHTAVQRPNHSINNHGSDNNGDNKNEASASPCGASDAVRQDRRHHHHDQPAKVIADDIEPGEGVHASRLSAARVAARHGETRREMRALGRLVPVCDPHAHVAADEPCSLAGPSNDGFHGRRAGRPALFASSIPLLSVE